ncbi:hypothetical protein ACEPAI_1929 [Sanghuangporus weigelae]
MSVASQLSGSGSGPISKAGSTASDENYFAPFTSGKNHFDTNMWDRWWPRVAKGSLESILAAVPKSKKLPKLDTEAVQAWQSGMSCFFSVIRNQQITERSPFNADKFKKEVKYVCDHIKWTLTTESLGLYLNYVQFVYRLLEKPEVIWYVLVGGEDLWDMGSVAAHGIQIPINFDEDKLAAWNQAIDETNRFDESAVTAPLTKRSGLLDIFDFMRERFEYEEYI